MAYIILETFWKTLPLTFPLLVWWALRPEQPKKSLLTAALVVATLAQVSLLQAVAGETATRQARARHAVYATRGDQAGGDTVQYAPSAAYQELTTREQTLTFSEHVFETFGLAALPGWSAPDAAPHILNVTDRLEKTPHATFIRRTLEFQQFQSVPLEASLLALDLEFVPDSVAYQAKFSGRFTFTNPLDRPARMRFTFPLPGDSGTLTGFKLTVDGTTSGENVWEGDVDPHQSVTVTVAYQNRGRRSWTYSPTNRRESLGHFRLDLTSDNHRITFRRDSLFPTATYPGGWEWDLQEVITSQDVSLFFPATPKPELTAKAMSFTPLLLILIAAWVGWTRGPSRALVATVGATLVIVLTSYLWTLLPFSAGLVAGAAVGAALSFRLDHSPLPWAAWLCFAWPGATGLLLSGLGLVLVFRRPNL